MLWMILERAEYEPINADAVPTVIIKTHMTGKENRNGIWASPYLKAACFPLQDSQEANTRIRHGCGSNFGESEQLSIEAHENAIKL
ncbi:hypothetical protein H5410_015787 [Solanum commersonii]|uniref:Uncharacterized protein n=1 Tax=Solanum commersonii TaxID=4109 RepID=A0A9J5ZV37_SOLCO|nr:hypothetical protein H5410_015787 [Solanum commersonii]